MKRDIQPLKQTYEGILIEVKQPGWYCTTCEGAEFSIDDITATDNQFIKLTI